MRWWVCRDLSNGDDADGRPFPTYIWAARTRRAARERKAEHRNNPKHARLSGVEEWTDEMMSRYEKVGGISKHWECAYYRRKG